jgi:hypothetical protein
MQGHVHLGQHAAACACAGAARVASTTPVSDGPLTSEDRVRTSVFEAGPSDPDSATGARPSSPSAQQERSGLYQPVGRNPHRLRSSDPRRPGIASSSDRSPSATPSAATHGRPCLSVRRWRCRSPRHETNGEDHALPRAVRSAIWRPFPRSRSASRFSLRSNTPAGKSGGGTSGTRGWRLRRSRCWLTCGGGGGGRGGLAVTARRVTAARSRSW